LRERHPEVYELLSACYRQDPARRTIPPEVRQSAEGADEEHSRQAIRECTAALGSHPEYLEAYSERASHYRALGEYEPALTDYAAVLARVRGEERAELLFERAQMLDEMDRLDEAIADLTEAIWACPEYGAALAHRGD